MIGAPQPPRLSWLQRPPGPLLALAAVAAAAGLMWASSVPMSDFDLVMYSVLAGLAVCAGWLLRTLCCLISTKRFSWWMAVVPAVIVLCLGLNAAEVPLRVRFALAENDFDRVAAAVAADPRAAGAAGSRIGSYAVTSIDVHSGRVYFTVAGSGFLGQGGFAYLPSGPPGLSDPVGESVTVTALTGPWYVFSSSW